MNEEIDFGTNGIVLIESDWNLKRITFLKRIADALVLIESDWNLKQRKSLTVQPCLIVLIESDWNLKRIKAPWKEWANRY